MTSSDRPRAEVGEHMSSLMRSVPGDLRRRLVIGTAARSIGIVTVLMVTYYLLPLDRPGGAIIVIWAVGSTLVLLATIALQLRAIRQAEYPVLRAVESVALAIPLLVVTFSATYVVLSDSDTSAFSEPLNHTDALYFTMVTLATIGFGDISAVSQTARLVVMVQIVANFVVLGVALKLIVGVARMSAQDAAARR